MGQLIKDIIDFDSAVNKKYSTVFLLDNLNRRYGIGLTFVFLKWNKQVRLNIDYVNLDTIKGIWN